MSEQTGTRVPDGTAQYFVNVINEHYYYSCGNNNLLILPFLTVWMFSVLASISVTYGDFWMH